MAQLAESMLLLVLLLVALAWPISMHIGPDATHNPLLAILTQNFDRGKFNETLFVWHFGAFLLPGGVLLLARFVRQRLLFLVLSAAWIVVCLRFALFQNWQNTEDLLLLAQEQPSGPPAAKLLLPSGMLQAIRLTVWGGACLLGGFYFVRHRYAWWKFTLGSVLSGWLAALFVMPIMLSVDAYLILQPLVFTFFGLALISMPLTRGNLERLLGFSLRTTAPHEELPSYAPSLAASIAGHTSLLALFGTLCSLGFVGYFERNQIDIILNGPPSEFHTAAELNAYPIFKDYFLKSTREFMRTPGFANACAGAALNGRADFNDATYWNGKGREETTAALEQVRPWLDAITSCSQCDYYEAPRSPKELGVFPVFETLRAVGTRAFVSMLEGNYQASLTDIQTIVRFSALLNDGQSIRKQSIGIAMRGIALDVAHEFYKRFHQDSAAMEALGQMLEQNRSTCHRGINWYALQRGEPGLLCPIVPNADITVRPFSPSQNGALGLIAQFDQLRIVSALERFKARHGSYPGRLEALVPAFLAHVPVDPYKGKPYDYSPQKERFSLSTSSCTVPAPAEQPFTFPIEDGPAK